MYYNTIVSYNMIILWTLIQPYIILYRRYHYEFLRASYDFIPDEDEGRIESRCYFTRHDGAVPDVDFQINAQGLNMDSGADVAYPSLTSVQFFVGDTIDTNGPDDAGTVKFQIKSDVTGTIIMKEIVLFIQR